MRALLSLISMAFCFYIVVADDKVVAIATSVVTFLCFITCELNDLNNKK